MTAFGRNLALGVGGAALLGAVLVVVLGGEKFFAVILVLVGASALAGALKKQP